MKFPVVQIKPKNTTGVKIQCSLKWGCNYEPEIISNPEASIIGFESIGFIISHSYKVLAFDLYEMQQITASSDDCENLVGYKLKFYYRISDCWGLGINFGKGTGTFGFPTSGKDYYHVEELEKTCCDKSEGQPPKKYPATDLTQRYFGEMENKEELELAYKRFIMENAWGYRGSDSEEVFGLALTILSILAIVYFVFESESLVVLATLYFVLSLIIISGIYTAYRFLKFRNRKDRVYTEEATVVERNRENS